MKQNTQKALSKVKRQKGSRSYKNFEGGESFTVDPKLELYKMVCSTLFGEPKFYEPNQKKADSSSNRIIQLAHQVAETDPEFVLKLAYYARTKMNLRTTPTVLLFESSIDDNTKRFVREWSHHIIQRLDEPAEIIAMYQKAFGNVGDLSKEGSLPNCIKKGIADVLTSGRFKKYQFAKYTAETIDSVVKLKDVIKITHPKPVDDNMAKLFKDIIEGNLKIRSTWKAITSQKGSTRESWAEAVDEMPIMALVKNLRNVLDSNPTKETINKVKSKLVNAELIKKSKLFPFRFQTAYKYVQENSNKYAQDILDALQVAMDVSVANMTPIEGTTATLIDVSGSMTGAPISTESKVYPRDIATLFGAMSHIICERNHLVRFASWAELIRLSTRDGIITNANRIANSDCGGSTETWKAVELLTKNKIEVDRIITFTDEIGYNSAYTGKQLVDALIHYRNVVNPKCYYYDVDLMGYGNAQVPDGDPLSCLISGWSERIFDYINTFESSSTGPIEEIEKITLGSLESKLR